MENYEKRIQWDPVFQTYKELKTLPDRSILIYFIVEVGYGIQGRDWLEKKLIIKDFPNINDQTLLSFSVLDPDNPKK